jgi:hypothetical protein
MSQIVFSYSRKQKGLRVEVNGHVGPTCETKLSRVITKLKLQAEDEHKKPEFEDTIDQQEMDLNN